MITIPLKRGASLYCTGTLILPSGTWVPTCKLNKQDKTFVQNLTVAFGSPALLTSGQDAGKYQYPVTLSAPATDTAGWPQQELVADILCTSNDVPARKATTDTFMIIVGRGETL